MLGVSKIMFTGKPMEMFFANQPAESMPRKTDNKSL
jgi:hypothetical protein